MKKFLSMFLVITILVTLFSTVTSATSSSETDTNMQIIIGSSDAKYEDEVNIPIYFNNIPPRISTVEMIITYDPTRLEYISSQSGYIIPSPSVDWAASKETPGEIKLLFMNYTCCTDYDIQMNGLFATLNFKVLSSSNETTELKVKKVLVGDGFLEIVPVTINSGKVTITDSPTPKYTVSGYVYSEPAASQSSEENAAFRIEFDDPTLSAITDSNGYFQIKNIPEGTHNIYISKKGYLGRKLSNVSIYSDKEYVSSNSLILWPGDLGEQDGAINLKDILEICKVFNATILSPGRSGYTKEYDFNNDLVINLEDIMIISKHYNETSSSY